MRCGGCAGIALPYPAQLAAKAERLSRALAPYALDPALDAVRGAEPRAAYRTRAKLVVAPDGAIGLYARGGHELVDLPGCRVLPPSMLAVVAALRALLPRARVPVRALDLRAVECEAAGGLLVTLVVEAGADPRRLAALADDVAALPGVLGVAASARAPRSPRVLGGAPRVLRGPAAVRDRLGAGLPFQLAAHGAFVQAHRGQARALQDAAVAALDRTLGGLQAARVLELFAGSGGLALRLAAAGAELRAVEADPRAAECAREAARVQGLALAVETGDATGVAADLARAGAGFDAVVVNPPRRGLAPELRAALARLSPRVLVYVSCEPATLARDLAHLAWLGLRARRLAPFDMIPQSAEVETLAVLLPAEPPALPLLHRDDGALVVDAPPHLAAALLHLVQRGWPEAAPAQPLDAAASGACLFARTPGGAARPPTHEYVALVRGVARAGGRLGRARYRRLAVVGGHALLRIDPLGASLPALRRALAGIGHPVLGDARHGHAPSNRHLAERHGLDRPFLHRAALTLSGSSPPRRIEAALAPDLAAVLESLGAESDVLRSRGAVTRIQGCSSPV